MRQYGNLSYTRIFQAGHSIPSYQPETAFQIFSRALFNLDIATGTQSTAGSVEDAYKSTGLAEPEANQTATGQELTYCYTYSLSSCYDWQVDMVQNGTAEICNWLFVDANTTQLFPDVIAKCHADWAGGNGTNASTPRPTSPPSFEGGAVSMKSFNWGAAWIAVALVAFSTLL